MTECPLFTYTMRKMSNAARTTFPRMHLPARFLAAAVMLMECFRSRCWRCDGSSGVRLWSSCFPGSFTRCWRVFSARSRPPPPNCPSAPTIWRVCVRPACGRGASRGDSRSTTTRARATGWVWVARENTATVTSGFKLRSRLAVFWDEDEDEDEDDAVTWQTPMTFSSARTWMLFFDAQSISIYTAWASIHLYGHHRHLWLVNIAVYPRLKKSILP